MTDGTHDAALAQALLAILAERVDCSPSELVGALRERAPDLPVARVRPVLDQLWQERRVARLWQRYLLPHHVDRVRAERLSTLDASPRTIAVDPARSDDLRRFLHAWDGWTEGERAS